MTHQQILDKLAAKHLIKSLDEDLARLTFTAMCYEKDTEKQFSYILSKLLNRWNCILKADNKISDNYKQTTILALSILLHKYGFKNEEINKRAIDAIDFLNKKVALSDDFFRKSEEIKQFIFSDTIPLKRKPTIPDSYTFYRAKDIISIQLENHYYVAYIHEITGVNETPILEFYNRIFDKIPNLKQLENLPAKGEIYDDGKERVSFFSISGLKYQPDLANQITLISSSAENKPNNNHLKKSIGQYETSDLFDIQDTIQSMFLD
jgi:hypothetical protein